MANVPTLVLPLALAFACGTAHAQSAEKLDPETTYGAHVSISAGEQPASLQIVPEGTSAPVAECDNYCDFWALPGRYTLYTRDHATGERRELGLRIKRSVRYSLQQGNDTARDAGLAVGITGGAAVLVGVILTAPVVLASMCEGSNCASDSERRAAAVGLGLIAGGAVAMSIGFAIFSHNRTKLTPITDPGYAAAEAAPSLRFGVVGVTGGLGLGGLAVF